MKIRFSLCTFALLTIFLSFGCREDEDITFIGFEQDPPVFPVGTMNLFGTVTQNMGFPAEDVTVTAVGLGLSTTTDENGRYAFPELSILETGVNLTFSHPILFTERRFFTPKDGSTQLLDVQMRREVIAGTINAAIGGSVSNEQQVRLAISPNSALLNGAPYAGDITVYLTYEDPRSTRDILDSGANFPGFHPDRGKVVLESYGMTRVRMETPNGEPITIDSAVGASLYLPPANLVQNQLRETVMLWEMRDSGWNLIDNSPEFSDDGFFLNIFGGGYFNCDLPFDWGELCGRLVNEDGFPLQGIIFSLSIDDGNSIFTFRTDQDGSFCAPIALSQPLVLRVLNACSDEFVLELPLGPYSNETTDLGNILVENLNISARSTMFSYCEGDEPNPMDVIPLIDGQAGLASIVYNDQGEATLITTNCSQAEQWIQFVSTDLERTSDLIRRSQSDLSPIILDVCGLLDDDEEMTVSIIDSTYYMSQGNFLLGADENGLTQSIRGRYVPGPLPEVSVQLSLPFSDVGDYVFPQATIELTANFGGNSYQFFCSGDCNDNVEIVITEDNGDTFAGTFYFLADQFLVAADQTSLIAEELPISGTFRINRR